MLVRTIRAESTHLSIPIESVWKLCWAVWLLLAASGCATVTPGPTVPMPGAENVTLTGHYYMDKYYFFPKGRDFEREKLFVRALKEGAEEELYKPDWRWSPEVSPEEKLAIEYDALSTLVAYSGKFHWGHGIVLGKVGRWREAVEAFQKATQAHPSFPGNWGNLGVAEHALGHYEQSVAAFEKALQLDPAYFQTREAQRAIWQASRRQVHPVVP